MKRANYFMPPAYPSMLRARDGSRSDGSIRIAPARTEEPSGSQKTPHVYGKRHLLCCLKKRNKTYALYIVSINKPLRILHLEDDLDFAGITAIRPT